MDVPCFVITGFGPFMGVTSNPTQALVEWLRQEKLQQLSDQQQAAFAAVANDLTCNRDHKDHARTKKIDYNVTSCTVLEVSADAVCQYMQQQAVLLQEACTASPHQPVVLLHLGVDTQRNGLNLELQAYNNATFRCPDQAGWQPSGLVIEQGDGLGLDSIRTTTLPVQELAQELRQAGYDCHMSTDAGRFVCNYTYHKSLQVAAHMQQLVSSPALTQAVVAACVPHQHHNSSSSSSSCFAAPAGGSSSSSDNGNSTDATDVAAVSAAIARAACACRGTPVYSLFVHVPPFSSIPEEKQRQFLLALLQAISRWLNTP